MIENRKSSPNDTDAKRGEDADKERIGLLKHIGTVSLAAMVFIGGGVIANSPSSLTLKIAAMCFLVSAISSLIACVLNVANFGIPGRNSSRFAGGEYVVNRIAIIIAVAGLCLGCLFLALRILCS